MWNSRENNGEGREQEREELIAVAVDKEKPSQQALKWATENVLRRGQTIKLVHVISRSTPTYPNSATGSLIHPLYV